MVVGEAEEEAEGEAEGEGGMEGVEEGWLEGEEGYASKEQIYAMEPFLAKLLRK